MDDNESNNKTQNLSNNNFINSNDNFSNKFKSKIIKFSIDVDYNSIKYIFLDNTRIISTFIREEMHDILMYIKFKDYPIKEICLTENELDSAIKLTKDDNYNFVIFPIKKEDTLIRAEFTNKNFDNGNIFSKYYFYEFNSKGVEWENYSKYIIKYIKRKTANKKYQSSLIPESLNIIDSVTSFYLNNSENNTIIINELSYNLPENEINRFYEIYLEFFNRFQKFIKNNLTFTTTVESILINRSKKQAFDFIMNRKLFSLERFKLKTVDYKDNMVDLVVEISDRNYNKNHETRCVIMEISSISCMVYVMHLLNTKFYDLKDRDKIKSATIFTLKHVKEKLEKETLFNPVND